MKFVCERDALERAVSTAYRAVASRSGALPVLSGLQATLRAGEVEFTGSDLELTIRARVPADVEGEGSAVLVGRLLVDTLAKLSPGHGSRSRSARTRRRSRRAGSGRKFARWPRPTSHGWPSQEGDAVKVAAGPFADGAAPGRAGRVA